METTDLSALSLDAQLSREWLTVNHLGGYAASTLPGCNTRKYHGLLVAALKPPVGRDGMALGRYRVRTASTGTYRPA